MGDLADAASADSAEVPRAAGLRRHRGLLMLRLPAPVYLVLVSPTHGITTTAASSGPASRNPNLARSAALVTIRDPLATAYPHQDLNSSRYRVNRTSGAI